MKSETAFWLHFYGVVLLCAVAVPGRTDRAALAAVALTRPGAPPEARRASCPARACDATQRSDGVYDEIKRNSWADELNLPVVGEYFSRDVCLPAVPTRNLSPFVWMNPRKARARPCPQAGHCQEPAIKPAPTGTNNRGVPNFQTNLQKMDDDNSGKQDRIKTTSKSNNSRTLTESCNIMKHLSLVAVGVGCLIFQAQATVLFSDGFNYTTGTYLGNNGTWGTGKASNLQIGSGNLTYSGLNDLGGNDLVATSGASVSDVSTYSQH